MAVIRKFGVGFVLWYLRFWARIALLIHRPIIIGIAGSVGKSSTKHILFAMMQKQAKVKFAYGNSETGIPLGILGLSLGSGRLNWLKNLILCPLSIFSLLGQKYLILEMATDQPTPPKNMQYLLDIVKPDVAIHLNAQPVHIQQFAASLTSDQLQLPADSQQAYIVRAIAFEDAKIITRSAASPAIINADDQNLLDIYMPLMANQPNRNLATFGQASTNQISYQNYSLSAQGTSFGFLLQNQPITVTLDGYILPQHFQQSVAAALLTMSLLKLDCGQSAASLNQFLHLPKSRSTVLAGINGSAIIDSSYNASAAAMLDMLTLITNLKQQTGRPIVLLLGDMRELGDQSATEHAKVFQAIQGLADYLYAVGPLTKQYLIDPYIALPSKPQHMRWFPTSLEAGAFLKQNLPTNALILVKGSQNTIFLEEAIKQCLADPKDVQKLCRQEKHWQKTKAKFFASQAHLNIDTTIAKNNVSTSS